MGIRRPSGVLLGILVGISLPSLALEPDALFTAPDFDLAPANVETRSEVRVTELFYDGGEFNGAPSRIHAFYARPEKPGRYPAVVHLHGAGLRELKADAAVWYAQRGFCCIGIDWCGPAKTRQPPRQPPYSEFESPGGMAVQPVAKGEPWKSVDPAASSITAGVQFVRRAVMFLQRRPEVDPDKLCLSGMSAGAHLSLLVLAAEPAFQAAAVKYGSGFIKELNWGGYFSPLSASPAAGQAPWLAALDPKHGLSRIDAAVLMISGTDDVFFFMPAVLETWRTIPSEKRLWMLPNDNHSQVGNEATPLRFFQSVLGEAAPWPEIGPLTVHRDGDAVRIETRTTAAAADASLSCFVKRMAAASFSPRKTAGSIWTEVPCLRDPEGVWSASISAPADDEQIVAFCTLSSDGIQVSSDTVEVPEDPRWRAAR